MEENWQGHEYKVWLMYLFDYLQTDYKILLDHGSHNIMLVAA